jgi:hypothetical protein
MLIREISDDELINIGKLFSTKLGGEVLGTLNRSFYDTISFDPSNQRVTDFAEGQRDIVHIFRQATKRITQEKG